MTLSFKSWEDAHLFTCIYCSCGDTQRALRALALHHRRKGTR